MVVRKMKRKKAMKRVMKIKIVTIVKKIKRRRTPKVSLRPLS